MSVSIDASIQLAWAIANAEANLAGERRIRPVHFLLGILKVADVSFLKQVESLNLPESQRQRIASQGLDIRHFLEMKEADITMFRRSLRKHVRTAHHPHSKQTLVMLHRSDESRRVFASVMTRASSSAGSIISASDLLVEMCQQNVIDIQALWESTVKTKVKVGPQHDSAGMGWGFDDDSKAARQSSDMLLPGLRNLTADAMRGNLPPIRGRHTEITRLVSLLHRTSSRNICLLGQAGIGRSSLVFGLAQHLITLKSPPDDLHGLKIIHIHGCEFAAICERYETDLQAILSDSKTALFITDGHLLLDALSHSPASVLGHIVPLLSACSAVCILSTTPDAYKATSAVYADFWKSFNILRIEELSEKACIPILNDHAKRIASIQEVDFAPDAIAATYRLTATQRIDQPMPARGIDLLENVAAWVKVKAFAGTNAARSVSSPRLTATAADVEFVFEDMHRR